MIPKERYYTKTNVCSVVLAVKKVFLFLKTLGFFKLPGILS